MVDVYERDTKRRDDGKRDDIGGMKGENPSNHGALGARVKERKPRRGDENLWAVLESRIQFKRC